MSGRNFHYVTTNFLQNTLYVVVYKDGRAVYKSRNPDETSYVFAKLKQNYSDEYLDSSYAISVILLRKISEEHNPNYWYVKSTPKLLGYSIATRNEVIIGSHIYPELLVSTILLARELYNSQNSA
jgi:hypothetical protein